MIPVVVSMISSASWILSQNYGIKINNKVIDFPLALLGTILIAIQLMVDYFKNKIDEWDEKSEINQLKEEIERLNKSTAFLINIRKNLVNRKINKKEQDEDYLDKILRCINEHEELNCGQPIKKEILKEQEEILLSFLD